MSWDFLPFKKLFERQILQIFFSVWLGNPRIDHLYLLHLPLGEGRGGEQGGEGGKEKLCSPELNTRGKREKREAMEWGREIEKGKGGNSKFPTKK